VQTANHIRYIKVLLPDSCLLR